MLAYWAARKSADSGDVCVTGAVSSDKILEAATVDDMAARNYSTYGAER
jgi:hypothetical protein